MTLQEEYLALVCDLDGVVYRGPNAVPHAVEALQDCTLQVLYATNNASRPPEAVAAHLRDLGLKAVADDVVTSSQAGAHYLAGRLPAGSAVLAVGGEGVAQALSERGLTAPVLPRQARAARAASPRSCRDTARRSPPPTLRRPRMPFSTERCGLPPTPTRPCQPIAAPPPATGPSWPPSRRRRDGAHRRGQAARDAVPAVRRAGPPRPAPAARGGGPARHGHRRRRGDRDGLRARADGSRHARLLATAPASMRPTYLLEDLRGLHTAYLPATSEADGWWACGTHRRRIVAGHWESEGMPGAPVESLRAAIAAVHAAVDDADLDGDDARRLVLEAVTGQ